MRNERPAPWPFFPSLCQRAIKLSASQRSTVSNRAGYGVAVVVQAWAQDGEDGDGTYGAMAVRKMAVAERAWAMDEAASSSRAILMHQTLSTWA